MVQLFGISEIVVARRQVGNLIFNIPTKLIVWNIAMEFLVKVLSLQQMGAGYGGGFRTFTLPPHSCHIVSPVEDCALPYTKTSCDTFLVQDTACHLKVIVCGAPCSDGPDDQVGNHI